MSNQPIALACWLPMIRERRATVLQRQHARRGREGRLCSLNLLCKRARERPVKLREHMGEPVLMAAMI